MLYSKANVGRCGNDFNWFIFLNAPLLEFTRSRTQSETLLHLKSSEITHNLSTASCWTLESFWSLLLRRYLSLSPRRQNFLTCRIIVTDKVRNFASRLHHHDLDIIRLTKRSVKPVEVISPDQYYITNFFSHNLFVSNQWLS